MGGEVVDGFVPPPYPYDRLDELRTAADGFDGGCVDLSVGAPSDPPPSAVVAALSASDAERGYPASLGSAAYREAAVDWLARRFGVDASGAEVAACVGTKEFVASVPHYLRLRDPSRDTVLYPAVSYPTYAMGATLAGCRAVPVPLDDNWCMDFDAVDPDDAARSLCLWVNSPGNPTGAIDDLSAAARWGRKHRVSVFSDECYIEFIWDGDAARSADTSILSQGSDGVMAVHSLSKRSNLAGVRAGFYAGDPELVNYLSEVRKHAGMMTPGPVQAAAVTAFNDDGHVDAQRAVYRSRLARLRELLSPYAPDVGLPSGGLYLWAASPDGDGWSLTRRVADELGALISPGEFYGPQGAGYARVAAVAPDAQIALLEQRMSTRHSGTVRR
ncbi:MAG: aminotransferase class I/II-fold pyridoxal phosphate-dependent enzyme [bacterium]|nr:aminotransferase class I/II-fold pyridoxal phosphate-dependent enzyme [bacterium]